MDSQPKISKPPPPVGSLEISFGDMSVKWTPTTRAALPLTAKGPLKLVAKRDLSLTRSVSNLVAIKVLAAR